MRNCPDSVIKSQICTSTHHTRQTSWMFGVTWAACCLLDCCNVLAALGSLTGWLAGWLVGLFGWLAREIRNKCERVFAKAIFGVLCRSSHTHFLLFALENYYYSYKYRNTYEQQAANINSNTNTKQHKTSARLTYFCDFIWYIYDKARILFVTGEKIFELFELRTFTHREHHSRVWFFQCITFYMYAQLPLLLDK